MDGSSQLSSVTATRPSHTLGRLRSFTTPCACVRPVWRFSGKGGIRTPARLWNAVSGAVGKGEPPLSKRVQDKEVASKTPPPRFTPPRNAGRGTVFENRAMMSFFADLVNRDIIAARKHSHKRISRAPSPASRAFLLKRRKHNGRRKIQISSASHARGTAHDERGHAARQQPESE